MEALTTSRFFALRYVWGQVSVFQTTKDPLPILQQDRGLLSFEDQIPSVIKDALTLVEPRRLL